MNISINNLTYFFSYEKIKDEQDFSIYKGMLPYLTPQLIYNFQNKEEVFKASQIYILDVRITQDYIRYIRPINETEEKKYKKQDINNETLIDMKLYEKRFDQYNYKNFCLISLSGNLSIMTK